MSNLAEGLVTLGIKATDEQITKLNLFLQLLAQWNKKYNLTAITNKEEMVTRHLLDSLSVLPYLWGDNIIDVGTGAGLPGIPLSIISEELHFTLLDSSQKKQIFVNYVIKVLALTKTKAVQQTVETYQPVKKFSTIITRAFAPFETMIGLTGHLLSDDGHILAMLGKKPESINLPTGFTLEGVLPLKVPGEKAQRHLAIVKRNK